MLESSGQACNMLGLFNKNKKEKKNTLTAAEIKTFTPAKRNSRRRRRHKKHKKPKKKKFFLFTILPLALYISDFNKINISLVIIMVEGRVGKKKTKWKKKEKKKIPLGSK